jgi:hypothetical protein
LTPVTDLGAVSYLALYPDTAPLTTGTPHTSSDTDNTQAKATAENTKIPFILALHPNPSQSPEQVRELVRTSFGAEHSDDEIVGDTIRVKLDPTVIPEVSKIDSIGTIDNVPECTPYSVRHEMM